MNEERFDELWGMAEAEGRGARLAAEYPAWRQRRQRTVGMMTLVAAVVLVATPMILPQRTPDEYLKVYCNNRSTSDRQWVSLASEMLLS